jgi:hypothetical protein
MQLPCAVFTPSIDKRELARAKFDLANDLNDNASLRRHSKCTRNRSQSGPACMATAT